MLTQTAHGEFRILRVAAPTVVALGGKVIGLRITGKCFQHSVQVIRAQPKSLDHKPKLCQMLAIAVALVHVIDRVQVQSIVFQEFPQSGKNSRQEFGRNVLQNRNRVNAIETIFWNFQSIGEQIADKSQMRTLALIPLEFQRSVSGPVIGIDDPYFVPQPIEQIRDQWLARADFQQPSSARDAPQNRLQYPGTLNVLQISIGRRQWPQMVHAVAEIRDCRIAERRDFEVHLVFRRRRS